MATNIASQATVSFGTFGDGFLGGYLSGKTSTDLFDEIINVDAITASANLYLRNYYNIRINFSAIKTITKVVLYSTTEILSNQTTNWSLGTDSTGDNNTTGVIDIINGVWRLTLTPTTALPAIASNDTYVIRNLNNTVPFNISELEIYDNTVSVSNYYSYIM